MEEEMKILERTIDLAKRTGMDITLASSIEKLLKRYKELEEENKRYKISLLQESKPFILGTIPISVIQNKKSKLLEEDDTGGRFYSTTDVIELIDELLEERR